MSQGIVQEITFFLHSVLMGLIITFAYDWILIFRRLFRHGKFWVSVEDFIYWFICGVSVFYMLYKENNGVLRWFAVVGAAIGMLFYKLTIKNRFVNIMSTYIHKIMWFVFRVIQVMLKPLKCLFSAARRFVRFLKKRLKKVKEFIKKRLTVFIKTLRIVLCKQ
ncbi:MAG: spore cortex biosynthesis protein YabQ [Lachnospiraceae bacterium]|nr:spore cortex biosynthesis protein YabQ [Lachnospiraceae bacterium]